MRTVEITENNEICKDEDENQRLVRNLQECINIFNKLNDEIKAKDIDLKYAINSPGLSEKIISTRFSITLNSASKTKPIEYVSQ